MAINTSAELLNAAEALANEGTPDLDDVFAVLLRAVELLKRKEGDLAEVDSLSRDGPHAVSIRANTDEDTIELINDAFRWLVNATDHNGGLFVWGPDRGSGPVGGEKTLQITLAHALTLAEAVAGVEEQHHALDACF